MSKDKNTITKFKAFLNIEKEIAYINKMNKEGWKLVYIKGGGIYTFVKTNPDEYVTVLYADKKENISQVTAFAAQCGYESVPHTMDGFGDFLYLTGKKSEVSESFVSDRENLMSFYEIARKKFKTFFITYFIFCIAFIGLLVSYGVFMAVSEVKPIFMGITILLAVFLLIYTVLTAKLFTLMHSYTKKLKKLKNDSAIFE